MTKYIEPKTGTVREVADTNQNKIKILERAGFIPLSKYKAPKKPKINLLPMPLKKTRLILQMMYPMDQSQNWRFILVPRPGAWLRKKDWTLRRLKDLEKMARSLNRT